VNQEARTGGDAHERTTAGRSAVVAPMLDAQYAELIESVWRCERVWKLEDRIEAVIRFGRSR
jgi:hypothetical protein